MAEPRVLAEQEIPDTSGQVHQMPRMPPGVALPPGVAPQARALRQPTNVVVILQAIAMVLAAKMQCFVLVLAMIYLSGVAVYDPAPLRLYAAGGFNLIALVAIWLLGHPPQQG